MKTKKTAETEERFCSLYVEAESDDEFAKEFFMFPPDESDTQQRSSTKRNDGMNLEDSVEIDDSNGRSKQKSSNNSDDDCDDIEYRIQYILDSKSLTAIQWTDVCLKMDTREVTRGSVLKQPDEEFFDESPVLVEKFLIKWFHASFLHLSWETEKDLIDLCGVTARNHIKKYRYRILTKTDLFEDLRGMETFPPQYLQIDRILDVVDDHPGIYPNTLNWSKAEIPPLIMKDCNDDNDENDLENEEGDDIQVAGIVDDIPDTVEGDTGEHMTPDNAVSKNHRSEKGDKRSKRRKTNESTKAPLSPSTNTEDIKTIESPLSDKNTSTVPEVIDLEEAELDDSSDNNEIDGNFATVNTSISTEDDEDGDDIDDKSKDTCENRNKVEKDGDDDDNYEDDTKEDKGQITRKRKSIYLKKTSNSTNKPSKSIKECNYLHGNNCWVTIKWEGLSYSEYSIEYINDLRQANIDYEWALREFYRREQLKPAIGVRGKCSRSLINASKVLECSTPPVFPVGTLRDYQWEGVRWLLFNWSQKRNSILADEMGLGKTIQTAAFLQLLKRYQNLRGPFLIVAPLSTVVNWQREISAWTDMDVIIYHGSTEDRELIKRYEFYYTKQSNYKKSDGVKIEVVIATPETCMTQINKNNNRKELSKINWEFIVIDEAHKLKNYDSKLSTTLREEYTYRNILLLTGTPLQNNIDELWTLLNFIDRHIFEHRDVFTAEFGTLKTAQQLERLHDKLKPYLLRREKDHVEKTVPPKEELIIEVELTVPQKQYYRAIYEQNTKFLFRGEAKDGPRLCNLAMELRKCCNHPFLIKGAGKVLEQHFMNDTPLDIMIKASGKMSLLDKLLPKLQADGHRVLIFSQFRMMLDIIEDYLSYRNFSYERVDGAVTGKKRQAAIDRYSSTTSTDPNSIFAMLLSTRAGGVGINLTAADTVIIFDSDWNPQNDLQAQARAHRIGQTKPVKVYRLLMRKSYEMVMFKAASLKLGLDYAIMHNMNISASSQLEELRYNTKNGENDDVENTSNLATNSFIKKTSITTTTTRRSKNNKNKSQEIDGITLNKVENYSSLSKKELENLLKHGAYDIFREEKDGVSIEESNKFYEADIEQILKSSAVVVHDDKGNSSITQKSAASFAKASFVSSISTTGVSDNIALDDPDFWTKVVKLAAKDEDQIEGNYRKRKCTRDIISYKEPSDALRSLYVNQEGHNDENDLLDSTQKKRKKVDEPEPVIWNSDNYTKLVTAMLARGYGNWNEISVESKLFWNDSDISYGCHIVLLQLLKWSCMKIDINKTNIGSNNNKDDTNNTMDINDDNNNTTDVNEDNLNSVPNNENINTNVDIRIQAYDMKTLMSILRKSRACRIALAIIYNTLHIKSITTTPTSTTATATTTCSTATSTTISTSTVSDELSDGPVIHCSKNRAYLQAEKALLQQCINACISTTADTSDKAVDIESNVIDNMKNETLDIQVNEANAVSATLTASAVTYSTSPSSSTTSNDVTRDCIHSFYQKLDEVCNLETSSEATDTTTIITTTIKSKFTEKDLYGLPCIDTVISVLNTLEIHDNYDQVESDRMAKVRSASRGKLSSIEDFYEISLLNTILHTIGNHNNIKTTTINTRDNEVDNVDVDSNRMITEIIDNTKENSVIENTDNKIVSSPTDIEHTKKEVLLSTEDSSNTTMISSTTQQMSTPISFTTVIPTSLLSIWTQYIIPLSDAPEWTPLEDLKLIEAVNKFGWPESKKRTAAIIDYFNNDTNKDDSDSQQDNSQTLSADTKTNTKDSQNTADMATETTSECTQSVNESQSDPTTTTSTSTTHIIQPWSIYLQDSKFILKRLKQMITICREIARPKYIEPIVLKEPKIIDETAILQVYQMKENRKFSQAIINVLMKYGRPRSQYIELSEEICTKIDVLKAAASTDYTDNGKYLLSWEEFTREVYREYTPTPPPTTVSTKNLTPNACNINQSITGITIDANSDKEDNNSSSSSNMVVDESNDGHCKDVQEIKILKVKDAIKELLSAAEMILASITTNTTAETNTDTNIESNKVISSKEASDETTNGNTDDKPDKDGTDVAAENTDNPKSTKNVVKMINTGIFMKVTYKTIEQCMEKVHIYHQLRMILTHHGLDNYFQLKAAIRRGCKGAGPSCPKPRRDNTLPVWWTVHHDIQLLTVVLQSITPAPNNLTDTPNSDNQDTKDNIVTESLVEKTEVPTDEMMTTSASATQQKKEKDSVGTNWKSIVTNDNVNKPLPNFTYPYDKSQEWVKELVPKIAEKRFYTILSTPSVFPTTLLVPPGSPDIIRKKQISTDSSKGKGINNSSSSSSKKPSSLFSNNNVNYGVRPSWVSSMMSSSTTATTKKSESIFTTPVPVPVPISAVETVSTSNKNDISKSIPTTTITNTESNVITIKGTSATVNINTSTDIKECSKDNCIEIIDLEEDDNDIPIVSQIDTNTCTSEEICEPIKPSETNKDDQILPSNDIQESSVISNTSSQTAKEATDNMKNNDHTNLSSLAKTTPNTEKSDKNHHENNKENSSFQIQPTVAPTNVITDIQTPQKSISINEEKASSGKKKEEKANSSKKSGGSTISSSTTNAMKPGAILNFFKKSS